MDRREQLERIIIASVLNHREYLREVRCIDREDIQDLLSRTLFDMLPDLCARSTDELSPLEVLFNDEGEQRLPKGQTYSALMVHALEVASVSDFNVQKYQYNLDALIDYYFAAKPYKPTQVQFKDYVSQFIRMTHGTTVNASR